MSLHTLSSAFNFEFSTSFLTVHPTASFKVFAKPDPIANIGFSSGTIHALCEVDIHLFQHLSHLLQLFAGLIPLFLTLVFLSA